MSEIFSDFQAIRSVVEHQKKEFAYIIPKSLMDRIVELLEMHQPHEPVWDESILNPDDYVRIGDIQELLSEKNGFSLDDESVFHAVGLIVWAMGKRTIKKEKLLKAQEALKPVQNEEKYGDALPHCPLCEKPLPNKAIYGKSNFCYHCGQAVKWE
jgi:hypothetical protein